MSVLNNLKKPTFSKAVMGYTPAEVDRYIEYINERYSTVSREATELKRRIIALQLRLDETTAELEEIKKEITVKKVLDRDAVSALFALLEREKTRHDDFLDVMKDKLSDMFADSVETDDDGDGEWEEVLEDFIELPSRGEHSAGTSIAGGMPDGTDASPAIDDIDDVFYQAVKNAVSGDTADGSDGVAEEAEEAAEDTAVKYPPYRAVFTFDDVSADRPPVADNAEAVSCGCADTAEKDDMELSKIYDGDAAEEIAPESAESTAEDEKEADTRSPAEIAAELDFYQDGEHADGESFDPMTLAHRATAQRSRPSLEDFLRSRDGGKKK